MDTVVLDLFFVKIAVPAGETYWPLWLLLASIGCTLLALPVFLYGAVHRRPKTLELSAVMVMVGVALYIFSVTRDYWR